MMRRMSGNISACAVSHSSLQVLLFITSRKRPITMMSRQIYLLPLVCFLN